MKNERWYGSLFGAPPPLLPLGNPAAIPGARMIDYSVLPPGHAGTDRYPRLFVAAKKVVYTGLRRQDGV